MSETDRGGQAWVAVAVLSTIVVGLATFAGVVLSLLSPMASDPCGTADGSFICTSGGQTQTLLIGLVGTAVFGIGSLVIGWRRRTWQARAVTLAAGALLTVAWVAGFSWWVSSLSP